MISKAGKFRLMTTTLDLYAHLLSASPARGSEDRVGEASDFTLARRAGGGDTSALGGLFRRHKGRVYSVCMRMTANTAEAEDLTQEVFIKLFHEAGTFRGESAFTTWLHRLTVNVVLMYFRRHKIRFERPTVDVEMPERPVPGTERPGRMPVFDRLELDRALAALPPGYRAVFVLFDIEGHTHDEIAAILGCSPGTSKSQLHRARERLRVLLREQPRGG